MTKYRVKTDQFKFLEKGEVINAKDTCEHDGQWVHFGILIENFPNWFEKIEPEVKEGQYWKWQDGEVFRIKEVYDKTKSCRIQYLNDVEKMWYFYEIIEDAKRVSDKEIDQALTEEANRRGFKKGVVFNSPTIDGFGEFTFSKNQEIKACVFSYRSSTDTLMVGRTSKNNNGVVYRRGSWAEIIEDEWETEDTFIGKAVSNKETQQKIISFIGELSGRQAEAIAKALNKL